MEPTILTTGLIDRVEQVRRTIFRLALVLLGTTLLAYPFAKHLLHIVQLPLNATLVIYAPLEGFLGHIKVSIATGVIITSPVILYEVKRFLQTVCRMSHKAAVGGTWATGGLFLLGVSFCYSVILPITLRFLLSFGGDNIATGISVSKYLALTLTLAAVCGVMFELPLVTFVLHRLGFISIAFLTQNRRYAVLVAAVVTAILTPTPDAFTMTMLLVPLLALYEVSILVLRIVERHAAHDADD
ncbi:MAG: twin-arginine translocase subunit TatC [bacterium]|nr:twin-arginine translocase subunit TatC [bacterium]